MHSKAYIMALAAEYKNWAGVAKHLGVNTNIVRIWGCKNEIYLREINGKKERTRRQGQILILEKLAGLSITARPPSKTSPSAARGSGCAVSVKYPAIYYEGRKDRLDELPPRVILELYVRCWYMAGWNDADLESMRQLTW